MAINPVVAEHLKEARSVLVAQRESLDRDIAQLDSMLQGYAEAASGSFAQGAHVSRGPAPAMKEAIIDHLATEDRQFTTHEVAVALQKRYGWQLSSTRSQIAKMGKTGEVNMVRRGVYQSAERARRQDPDAPFGGTPTTDTSAPSAELGAEVTGESDSDSPLQEGGTEYGSASPEGRDHRVLDAHRDRDHVGDRASIGGLLPA